MMIEKDFKPPIYYFVVYQSVEAIQQKLQALFDRSFVQTMLDGRYNIHGYFSNAGRSTFRLSQAGGIHQSGSGSAFEGELSYLADMKTAICLKPTFYISHTKCWLLSLLAGMLLICFVISIGGSLGMATILTAMGASIVLFVLLRIRQLLSEGLLEDFESVLKETS